MGSFSPNKPFFVLITHSKFRTFHVIEKKTFFCEIHSQHYRNSLFSLICSAGGVTSIRDNKVGFPRTMFQQEEPTDCSP